VGQGPTLRFEEGLQPIHVRATWNWNYLWTKQPLRDLCRPTQALFKSAENDGWLLPAKGGRLQGLFKCGENLSALEVLEEGEEIYGVGYEKEYRSSPEEGEESYSSEGRDKDQPSLIDTHTLFWVTYQGKSGKPFIGKLTVNNASFELLPTVDRGFTFHTRKGDAVFVNFKASILSPPAGFFLAIPRQDIARGVLDLDFNAVKGAIALKPAQEIGMAAVTGEDGVSVVVRPWTWLPDIPPRINLPEASFDVPFAPHVEDAVYYMRAITVSGKTYRSPPLFCRGARSGDKVKLAVYSETRREPVDVLVAKERVPDLVWEFSPRGGGVLPSRNAPRWNGQLGGALLYGEPFHSRNYPAGTRLTAPEWVTEDGVTCLKFDGVGTFVHFPFETFPRGSFTMHFEFKPLSDGNQVLFTHHGSYIGSLTLRMDKGCITATFVDSEVNEHRLDPEIFVPIGEWSAVDVIYDYRTFRVRVNGKEGKPVPLSARALYRVPSVFGGYPVYDEFYKGAPKFFQGYLKAFRITHRAE
ncbi:MAG: LamG-like jellyroll fold domain-containing protein, partial [Kiritimatiellia bacterium]|nr:LamG-like jellyroll fold domain-containing protein [Kiritimatiellia bacterium]